MRRGRDRGRFTVSQLAQAGSFSETAWSELKAGEKIYFSHFEQIKDKHTEGEGDMFLHYDGQSFLVDPTHSFLLP